MMKYGEYKYFCKECIRWILFGGGFLLISTTCHVRDNLAHNARVRTSMPLPVGSIDGDLFADIHGDISNLVELQNPSFSDVEACLHIKLLKEDQSAYWEFFESASLAGSISQVFFSRARHQKSWKVVLEYGPDYRVSSENLDLTRYGNPVNTFIVPEAPPEGTISYVYDYRGFSLFIKFSKRTRQLLSIALHRL